MTAASRSARPGAGGLPAEVTTFVGRRQEINAIKGLLSDSRCVTLTGAGGVGKTRLALKVAASVRRTYHDQTYFIELAQLREATLLASVVADQLGLRNQSSRPALDVIVDHLRDRELLLVLDNCEHLIDECARLVNVLLHACRGLHVIATSRQSLGIGGESVFAVPPLPVPPLPAAHFPGEGSARPPPLDELRHYDSVQLFLDRVRAVMPNYELTSEDTAALVRLCHHVDGLPLALELAAVAMRTLSLPQLEERLSHGRPLAPRPRGMPERHQALRNLIEWSYRLCTERERLAWERTSVFSGTFDLDTAEHVASNGDLRAADVLDLVDSLVDKSILTREEHQGTVRYRLLDLLREFGQEKLIASGQLERIRHRLRDWYSGLTERFDAEWLGPDQGSWIERLRRDHANLRVALDFCATEPGEARRGLRMVSQIHEYWSVRGFHTEARYWLDRMLPAVPEPVPERLSGLRLDAWFALMQGEAADELFREAVTLAERLGERSEAAHLADAPGMVALVRGDLDRAEKRFTDALSLFRAARNVRGEVHALFHLGLAVGLKDERERGIALLSESVAKTTEYGDVYWRSWALWGIAEVESLHGDLGRAHEAGQSALRLQKSLDNRFTMAFTLDTLAGIAALRDQHHRAATLFGCAAAVWEAVGTSAANFGLVGTVHDDRVDRARQALGAKAYDQSFERGYALPTGSAIDYGLETPELGQRKAVPVSPSRDDRSRTAQGSALTRREREIANLVAQGYTNKDIAKRLFIAQRTAEAHVENILIKLGFTSRAQVATWVIENAKQDNGSDHEPQ